MPLLLSGPNNRDNTYFNIKAQLDKPIPHTPSSHSSSKLANCADTTARNKWRRKEKLDLSRLIVHIQVLLHFIYTNRWVFNRKLNVCWWATLTLANQQGLLALTPCPLNTQLNRGLAFKCTQKTNQERSSFHRHFMHADYKSNVSFS